MIWEFARGVPPDQKKNKENQRKSKKIKENQRKSQKIEENRRKSKKIGENQRKAKKTSDPVAAPAPTRIIDCNWYTCPRMTSFRNSFLTWLQFSYCLPFNCSFPDHIHRKNNRQSLRNTALFHEKLAMSWIYIHTYIHTCLCAYMHAYACTQIRIHTHTHTRTHMIMMIAIIMMI